MSVVKILVVEDHPLNRTIIQSALGDRLGCSTLLAADGREALSMLAKNQDVGLIITDLNMPEIDGIELIETIRNHPVHKKIPIIVCTMDSSVEKVVQVARLGVTHFIAKPIKVPQLQEKVREALQTSPVAPPPQLEILLMLGIDRRAYSELIEKTGQAMAELFAQLENVNGGRKLETREIRKLSRMIWPDVFKAIAS